MSIKFGMLQVRENEISLRKWAGGTAQLRTLEGTLIDVKYNIAFTATAVASKILTSIKANYLKYQAMAKFLNQVISKDCQVSITQPYL